MKVPKGYAKAKFLIPPPPGAEMVFGSALFVKKKRS